MKFDFCTARATSGPGTQTQLEQRNEPTSFDPFCGRALGAGGDATTDSDGVSFESFADAIAL